MARGCEGIAAFKPYFHALLFLAKVSIGVCQISQPKIYQKKCSINTSRFPKLVLPLRPDLVANQNAFSDKIYFFEPRCSNALFCAYSPLYPILLTIRHIHSKASITFFIQNF
jgi:hypothetical protein